MVASAGEGAAIGAVTSSAAEPLPDDIETLKATLLAKRSARQAAEKLIKLRELEIEKLKHRIAQLQHERFGQSSERRPCWTSSSCNCSSWRRTRLRPRRRKRSPRRKV